MTETERLIQIVQENSLLTRDINKPNPNAADFDVLSMICGHQTMCTYLPKPGSGNILNEYGMYTFNLPTVSMIGGGMMTQPVLTKNPNLGNLVVGYLTDSEAGRLFGFPESAVRQYEDDLMTDVNPYERHFVQIMELLPQGLLEEFYQNMFILQNVHYIPAKISQEGDNETAIRNNGLLARYNQPLLEQQQKHLDDFYQMLRQCTGPDQLYNMIFNLFQKIPPGEKI